jgi:hypothetical protein
MQYTVYLLWIEVWQFLIKVNIHLPLEPPVLLLGVYPREMKTYVHKNTCTRMFIVALFIIAPSWKQPRSPSAGEQVHKQACLHEEMLLNRKR